MNINPRIHNKMTQGLPLLYVMIFALGLSALSGCTRKEEDSRNRQEIEYTIVEQRDIPEKLLETIEQKKQAEIKISFENENDLYLVRGYGVQETGGYSIVVRELYLTEHALYFDTELLGPENGSSPQKKPSYPYIVVKTGKHKQNVVFG